MSSSSSSKAVSSVPYRAYHVSHLPEAWIVDTRPVRKARPPYTKFIERQVIQAWKRVTGAAQKHQRSSLLPKDFVLVTSRRRSVMFR